MQGPVLLQPHCSVLELNGLSVKHSAAKGDVGICAPWDYPTGQSWFGFWLGQSHFSQTNQDKQGSTGQIYAKGQTIPKHVTLSENFMNECEASVNSARSVLRVMQLHGQCSSISSLCLLPKFTLAMRNRLRRKHFSSKISLVTNMGKYSGDQLSISKHTPKHAS